MKTLRDEKCRIDLIDRINRLTVDSKPAWGRMNVEQMLSHLVQSGEMPFIPSVPDGSNWFTRKVMKPLSLYVLPIPKGIKTSAEVDQQQAGRTPSGFDSDKASVIEGINRLGTVAEDHNCLDHSFFGKMSAKEWGVLGYKHFDHHLRQFGV